MATAPEHRFALGPLCMSISVAAFEAWLVRADVGAKLVYAQGPVLDQKRDVVVMARELAAQGEVRTHQGKRAGVIEYYVIRRRPEAKLAAVVPLEPAPETQLGRMLAIIRRCVKLGLPCRTNGELAREMSLKDAEAARYLFNQLVEQSIITVRPMGPGKRRVVTMIANGKSTAEGRI